jgi:hypothetical protein
MTQLLLVFSNPVDGCEDEYNDWYSNQHLDEILAIEGFVRAQRFELAPAKMTNDTPLAPYRYLAIYEVADGALERADSALFELARTERAEAIAAGRKPKLVMSDAMDGDLRTWWFSSISDVVASKDTPPS